MELKQMPQWSEKISTVLRKTAMNLTKINKLESSFQEEYVRPYTTMASSFQFDFSQENRRPDEHISLQKEIAQNRSQIERMVLEKDSYFRQELDKINDRLLAFEATKQEIHYDDIETALSRIETKAISEINALESQIQGFATQEDLKGVENSVKDTHVKQLTQLELEFKELKTNNTELKQEVFHHIEDSLRNYSSKNISYEDLQSIQNTIVTETRHTLENHMRTLEEKIEMNKTLFFDSYERIEHNFDAFKSEIQNKQHEMWKQLDQIKQTSRQTAEMTQEELKHLTANAKQLETAFNAEDFEEEIAKLKQQMQSGSDMKKIEDKLVQQDNTYNSIIDKIGDLEQRIIAVEIEGSDRGEFEPEELSSGLEKRLDAARAEDEKKQELVKISLIYTGESDDDSQGFVSPNISPMNQVVGQSAPKPQKHFEFNNPTIQEELHEDESLTPIKRTPDSKQIEVDQMIEQTAEEFIQEQLSVAFDHIQLVIKENEIAQEESSENDIEIDSDIDFSGEDLPI